MTVRELIGELTTMPQDMEAWVYAEDAEYVSAPVIFAERAGGKVTIYAKGDGY